MTNFAAKTKDMNKESKTNKRARLEFTARITMEDGYRDSAAAINRTLHRGDEAILRSTVLKDRTVSFGMRLADKYDELAHGILASQGIDPGNGFPLQASSIPATPCVRRPACAYRATG